MYLSEQACEDYLGKRTANSLFTKNGFFVFFDVFRLSLIILK